MSSEKRLRRTVPRLAFNQQEAAEALGVSVDHFARHVKPDLPVVPRRRVLRRRPSALLITVLAACDVAYRLLLRESLRRSLGMRR